MLFPKTFKPLHASGVLQISPFHFGQALHSKRASRKGAVDLTRHRGGPGEQYVSTGPIVPGEGAAEPDQHHMQRPTETGMCLYRICLSNSGSKNGSAHRKLRQKEPAPKGDVLCSDALTRNL